MSEDCVLISFGEACDLLGLTARQLALMSLADESIFPVYYDGHHSYYSRSEVLAWKAGNRGTGSTGSGVPERHSDSSPSS